MPTKKKQTAKHQTDVEERGNELCCCPPRARVWIETRTEATFIENKIDMKRTLQVRADANTTIRPPAGPDANADGSGGSQIDEATFKDQGKVYRADVWIIHWSATGDGDLEVTVDVPELGWSGAWLETSGSVELSKAYLLEPPDYDPPATAPSRVEAIITVRDCCGQMVRHRQAAMRP